MEEKNSSGKFGVASDSSSELFFPALQPSVIIPFRSIPLHKGKNFLLENYVENGLNIAEVAAFCFSSRCAVRNGLKKHEITIKAQDQLLKSKFSYWKISDILNTMNIKTKTGRGRWQARSVQKTLTGV